MLTLYPFSVLVGVFIVAIFIVGIFIGCFATWHFKNSYDRKNKKVEPETLKFNSYKNNHFR